MDWKACANESPANGSIVDTMVKDGDGERNKQKLKRDGGLWWLADGSMYIYYTPTHWK